MNAHAAKPPFEVRGWHVLAGVVAFFAVVFTLDAIFVIQAVKTYPGQVSETPYEDGLAYNRTLDQRAAQAALGWSAAVSAGEGGVVEVAFRDRHGEPITGLKLRAVLDRPATEVGQIRPSFQEARPGIYIARTGAARGGWDLKVSAGNAAGQTFGVEQRLVWR